MRYYSHLFQMPPKKVKHGGARVDAGRKSLTGEYGNDKTMEEKKKADRNRKAKDRGQLKVPEARSVVESGDDGKDRESVRIGTGRPPLDPEAGPMKGAVRAEYKLENQRQNRKKQKIRQIRQQHLTT